MTEKVFTFHWICTGANQSTRIRLGQLFVRQYTKYTRLKISARVGDVHIFARCEALDSVNTDVGTLTDAQIAAGAPPDAEPVQLSGTILTPHAVVTPLGQLDTGDINAPIGDSDYITLHNPVSATALEVQVEVRVKS